MLEIWRVKRRRHVSFRYFAVFAASSSRIYGVPATRGCSREAVWLPPGRGFRGHKFRTYRFPIGESHCFSASSATTSAVRVAAGSAGSAKGDQNGYPQDLGGRRDGSGDGARLARGPRTDDDGHSERDRSRRARWGTAGCDDDSTPG